MNSKTAFILFDHPYLRKFGLDYICGISSGVKIKLVKTYQKDSRDLNPLEQSSSQGEPFQASQLACILLTDNPVAPAIRVTYNRGSGFVIGRGKEESISEMKDR